MDEQLADILRLSNKMEASDVHLRVGTPPVFRVAGRIQISSALPLGTEELQKFFDSTATPTIRKMFEVRKDVDYSVSLPGVSRFRVNCFLQQATLAFVFRQIPFELPTVDSIKLPSIILDSVTPTGSLLALRPHRFW